MWEDAIKIGIDGKEETINLKFFPKSTNFKQIFQKIGYIKWQGTSYEKNL
ncbi:hypothetical protein LCM20_08625 [Halobacillus litoralis]|nr:hypothetical protein [Halobacillus litoralis]MCA0970649.1 hypothetical protein [Halobacillus litoralis]